MNHILVHNREDTGQASGSNGSPPPQGDGQVTVGSGPRPVEKWGWEEGRAQRRVHRVKAMSTGRGFSTKADPGAK